MSDLNDIVWEYLTPEDIEYCKITGLQRQIYREQGGNRNRAPTGDGTPEQKRNRAILHNQIGVKGELAFANRTGLAIPTAGNYDPRCDFHLGKWRLDIKTNGSLFTKHLLVADDRGSPPDPAKTDILVLAATKDLDEPWVGLIGWIGVDSWFRQRTRMLWGKTKRPTFVIPQDRLNPITTLPSWPIDGPPKPDIKPDEGEQNRLL